MWVVLRIAGYRWDVRACVIRPTLQEAKEYVELVEDQKTLEWQWEQVEEDWQFALGDGSCEYGGWLVQKV